MRHNPDPRPGKLGPADPIRFVFVLYGADWIRGTEIVLLELLRRMDGSRFTPFGACNSPTVASEAEALGVETCLLARPTVQVEGFRTRVQGLRWMGAVRQLRAFARQVDADVYCCINGQPSMVAYYAGGRGRIPCIYYIQSFYIRRDIHFYRMTRVPSLVFCSKEIRDSITRKARLRGHTHVVHNGVDLTRFRPPDTSDSRQAMREAVGISPDSVVFGPVGSLIQRKGADLLVEATARLRNHGLPAHLALVGSGPDEDELKTLVRSLSLEEHVTFAGNVADPAPWYRNVFDVNALASREEAFGIALIEGAASGLPLLAARTGGMTEVVDEGVTGLFFKVGEADDLAEKMSQLLVRDDLRSRMGTAARSAAERRFSIEAQVAGIESVDFEAVHGAGGEPHGLPVR